MVDFWPDELAIDPLQLLSAMNRSLHAHAQSGSVVGGGVAGWRVTPSSGCWAHAIGRDDGILVADKAIARVTATAHAPAKRDSSSFSERGLSLDARKSGARAPGTAYHVRRGPSMMPQSEVSTSLSMQADNDRLKQGSTALPTGASLRIHAPSSMEASTSRACS